MVSLTIREKSHTRAQTRVRLTNSRHHVLLEVLSLQKLLRGRSGRALQRACAARTEFSLEKGHKFTGKRNQTHSVSLQKTELGPADS